MTSEGQPEPRADDWMALVERTLPGRDLAGLTSTTRDGIEIRPLYTDGPDRPFAASGASPGRSEAGWDIRQNHGAPAASTDVLDGLRDQIAQDLAGGVTSVDLEVVGGVTIDELSSLLAGVDLSEVPLALAPHASLGSAEALDALASQRGSALAVGSSLGFDPLGEWARSGRLVGVVPAAEWTRSMVGDPGGGDDLTFPVSEPVIDEAGAAPGEAPRLGPGVMAFTVDATRYADAGATEAQALGWATATGVAYLRALVEGGLEVDAAARLVGFRMAATADQFVTIAALRAARVMWTRVVTASGGSAQSARQYQHAVTATHMYSRRDPWVNLLRGASAALAAGVAGADAVTVLPFDHASGSVDADGSLGRRLARNTQLLLLEESHLARAADPAGGSFYVESLTDQLASEGWRVLQEIEASGGIEAAISDGTLAAALDQSWRGRLEALRSRSEPLVGVSEFPLLDEPAQAGRAGSSTAPSGSGLPVRRLAEPFEDLRDAADRHRAATGDRPAAWVAALGPAADHSTRTAWAQNLLAAGGIEARGAAGVVSPIAAAADFTTSGLAAVVVTGTDEMYRLRGHATASALTEAGAAFVALVCDPATPAELLSELQSAGVDETWHDGIDAAAALERLHRTLGVVGAGQPRE